jgi:hypothetical protein
MRHRRNRFGQAYGLTVMHSLLPGHDIELAGYLDGVQGGDASPLARVPGTHFARWVVMSDVVFQGAGQRRRDSWSAPRLLFTSSFDGELDAYLDGLREGMGEDADAIWEHCAGYPGRDEPAAFREWFHSHQIESSLFYAAYGDRTVEQVRADVDARARLMRFALQAQGLPAEELQERFRRDFA